MKVLFQVKDEKLNLTAMSTESILLTQENSRIAITWKRHRTFYRNNYENYSFETETTKTNAKTTTDNINVNLYSKKKKIKIKKHTYR